ncbi:Oxysterol-binding protein-related protein 1C [Platanthera zijinensis]|uniref:Oxysterol-binding protein-related protein 1C n=1 Tax=Platanthera zijinensis TaxID=2320716 RepID=A0AAP0BJF2_9ASPA
MVILFGKWDDSMHYVQELLPPTNSRLRPNQRCLENGEFDMANSEKSRLEQRQRQVYSNYLIWIPHNLVKNFYCNM